MSESIRAARPGQQDAHVSVRITYIVFKYRYVQIIHKFNEHEFSMLLKFTYIRVHCRHTEEVRM